MTKSAVLFLIFNRPDQTARTFEAIRQARPARLYIAADGPRTYRPDDAERCARVRAIATAIDWPCEVRTLFRDQNLGCKKAISSAIDWFFEQEADGIILEDDCYPAASFFPYCEELLERYRDDLRVMSICGSNSLRPKEEEVEEASYFFSRHCRVWGWATWRRAWQHYDVDMESWPIYRAKRQLRVWSDCEEDFENFWTRVLDRTYAGEVDTWDYQWMFACWANGGLSCRPRYNMISNLGFGADATHTFDPNSIDGNAPVHEIEFPLRHPTAVLRDFRADQTTQERQFQDTRPRPLFLFRALRRMVRYLRRR